MNFIDLNIKKNIGRRQNTYVVNNVTRGEADSFKTIIDDMYNNSMFKYKPSVDIVEKDSECLFSVDFKKPCFDDPKQTLSSNIEFRESMFEKFDIAPHLEKVINKCFDVLDSYFLFNTKFCPEVSVFEEEDVINVEFCVAGWFSAEPAYLFTFDLDELFDSGFAIIGEGLDMFFQRLYKECIIDGVPYIVKSGIKGELDSNDRKVYIDAVFLSPYSEKLEGDVDKNC